MEDTLKKLILDTVIKAVIAKAVAAVPFLGWPLINPVLGLIVGKIFELAYDELYTGLQFIIIDNDAKLRAQLYHETAEELRRVIDEKGMDNEEARKLSEEFDRRLRDLIKFPK